GGKRLAHMPGAEKIDMRPSLDLRAHPRPQRIALRVSRHPDVEADTSAAALADLGPQRNVQRTMRDILLDQLARLGDCQELELPAANRAEGGRRRDEHPRARLARGGALHLADLHNGGVRMAFQKMIQFAHASIHRESSRILRQLAAARNRSTAMSTRSGVAGASRRGQIL